jgi:hypothetical protein
MSHLSHPFAAKGRAGGRRGDSSDFTVTATRTRQLGFKKIDLFSVAVFVSY